MIDDEDLQTLVDKQQQAVMGDTSNLYNSYKIRAITQLILISIPPC
jgi:hypothetical protein